MQPDEPIRIQPRFQPADCLEQKIGPAGAFLLPDVEPDIVPLGIDAVDVYGLSEVIGPGVALVGFKAEAWAEQFAVK